jgi:23S rRNA pseudouridine2605 synthase
MFYDEERDGNRYNSDSEGPKKRKRISTGKDKYEKVQIRKNSSPDGQRERRPRFNPERDPDYNFNRDPNYNKPFTIEEDINYNTDEPIVRRPRRDDNDGNYNRRPSYGSSSRSYGSDSRSYGGDSRGGFKKQYGNRPGGKPHFNKRGDKPYGRQGQGQRPRNDRYDSRPQKQPDYFFDEEPNNSPVRLNKFIANTGLCSRREADEYIQAGLITVNGTLIKELGVKVMPTDDVRYNGVRIVAERKVYILLNKPKDYVTSVDDPHAKRTIMELVSGACKERIYPVGRLDRMTTGVILLTNDGELTKKLTHPTSEIKKIYQVHLDKNLKEEDFKTLEAGVTLDDGFIKPDAMSFIPEKERNVVGIEIHSGKNRIVRRMFEQIGYKVIKLDRVFFAGLTKKGLSRGKWRYLAFREVGYLKMMKV